MIINLTETELFGEVIKLYTFTENDCENITAIYLNDNPLDVKSPADVKLTIDFLKSCYAEPEGPEILMAAAILGSFIDNSTEIVKNANETLDRIIVRLEKIYDELTNTISKIPTHTEDNSLNIARHYMDEVIDPKGIMDAVEYNKLLSMFAMYNHWVMNR
jgi:hypothetical protein